MHIKYLETHLLHSLPTRVKQYQSSVCWVTHADAFSFFLLIILIKWFISETPMGVHETTPPPPPPHLRLQATSWLTEITFHARRLVFAELSNSTAQERDDDPLKQETHLRTVFMKAAEEQDGKQELQEQNGKQELKEQDGKQELQQELSYTTKSFQTYFFTRAIQLYCAVLYCMPLPSQVFVCACVWWWWWWG